LNFKQDNGNTKVVIAVVSIILAILIGIIVIKLTNKNAVVTSEEISYEYFAVYTLDEKVGVIDKNGNEIIKPIYSNIYIPNQSKDVFICFKDDNNYSILDSKGKDIFTQYSSVYPITISDTTLEMEKNVLSYEEDGKYGLIDYSGKKLTNAIYDEVSSLKNKPGCIQVKKDGLYGVLDSNGNVIIDVKYNSVKGDEYSSEADGYSKTGYIISEKTNSGIIYGYIDYNGKMIIEPKYESITRCLEYEDDDIYLVFMQNGKKGVMKNKKTIIKAKYQSINYYNVSNIFAVNRNGKYGFYNNSGDEILPVEYTDYSIAGNYIAVKKDDSMLLYDVHGNLVNTNNYKSIIETSNPSYFIAKNENGYYSIISKDFQIEDNYTAVSYAFDNFFVYTTEDGKSGVLNVYTGDEINPEYDVIIVLDGAKALEARKGNQLDIYSENFEKILTMSDGIVEKVSDDYFSIYSDTEMKYIDKKGNLVSNTEVYKDLNIYAYQTDDGKWGFADKNGNIVVDCKYDIVTELNQYGFAGICQDGKWGVIDQNGKVIVVPSYEIETYYEPSFVGKYLLEEGESVYCTEVE
jgi:hypothetical protein